MPHLRRMREMALVAHALPHAEMTVSLVDGRRFALGNHPAALVTPCLFRRAVCDELAKPGSVAWLTLVDDAELRSTRCRDLGAGLYSAWCGGAAVHAFSTEIDLDVLVAVVEAIEIIERGPSDRSRAPGANWTAGGNETAGAASEPVRPRCETSVRIVPDAALGMHLVTVEAPTSVGWADATDLAREIQATVLVAELEAELRAG